jgi:tetratricopeptide (TPR) repeat protein
MKKILFILLFGASFISNANSIWKDSYALEASAQYAEAAALIKPFVSDFELSELADMRLAWLNYLQGNYSKSISYYKDIIDNNENSIDAYIGITLPFMAQKRYKNATKYTKKALKISPYNYSASAKLMFLYYLQGKWSSLRDFSSNVSKHYPALVEPLVYLARAYNLTGDKKLAKKTYKKVLALFPTHIEANSGIK